MLKNHERRLPDGFDAQLSRAESGQPGAAAELVRSIGSDMRIQAEIYEAKMEEYLRDPEVLELKRRADLLFEGLASEGPRHERMRKYKVLSQTVEAYLVALIKKMVPPTISGGYLWHQAQEEAARYIRQHRVFDYVDIAYRSSEGSYGGMSSYNEVSLRDPELRVFVSRGNTPEEEKEFRRAEGEKKEEYFGKIVEQLKNPALVAKRTSCERCFTAMNLVKDPAVKSQLRSLLVTALWEYVRDISREIETLRNSYYREGYNIPYSSTFSSHEMTLRAEAVEIINCHVPFDFIVKDVGRDFSIVA